MHRGASVQLREKWTTVLLACLATLFAGSAFAQSAPTPIAGVTVTGTYSGPSSVTVLCTGEACGSVIESLIAAYNATHEEPLNDEPVATKAVFCNGLKNAKPSGCSYSSPPPYPGIGTNWAPNACGTGGFSNFMLDKALEVIASNQYSGNFNSPSLNNVDFSPACNAHDQCYAVQGGKDDCDLAFRDTMQAACGTDANCQGWASQYHAAVSVMNAAATAYSDSGTAKQCALWNHDMRQNSCPS